MEEYLKNKEAFVAAYNENAEAIFRYCVFRIFDRERSRELMQETFTKTWEYLKEGNEIQNLRAFLYKVAHNLCVNEVIRRKAYSLDSMKEDSGFDLKDAGSRTPEETAELALLLKCLGMLKPAERDILEMRYVDDLKVSEIAEILGALPNTISVRLKRAENSLKKNFNKNGE